MDNEDLVLGIYTFNMTAKHAVSGLLPFLTVGDGERSGMFVDYNEIMIFIDDADASVFLFFCNLMPAHFNQLARLKRMIELGYDLTIDHDLLIP